MLLVILVEAETGFVRGLRAVSLSSEFTAALHRAIASQATQPWRGKAHHDASVDAIYRRYPETTEMVRRVTSRCRGGAA
jgi:hypothetical protein